MLSRLFGWSAGRKKPPITYDQEKELVAHPDAEVRADLASREDARPEILYFLANDKSPSVRAEIAANASTPRQADKLLASDVDDDVRKILARKIGRLIPGLSEREAERLRNLTFEVLEILAEDHVAEVRQIVAEEIKHAANVPPHIVKKLARDIEHIVSTPILQYSVLLSDQDLLEIVAGGGSPEVLSAISRRLNVSTKVCDAIVSTNETAGIAALLANPSAQIREETLNSLIDKAPSRRSWHEPLVRRPRLSPKAVRRIAGFVAAALLNVLSEREDIDDHAREEVRRAVKKRLAEEPDEAPAEKEKRGGAEGDAEAAKRAKKLLAEGKLDDEAIRAAAEMGQRPFVNHALALRAKLPVELARAVTASQAGKPMTALCWRASLSMRTALTLQKHQARISSASIVNARNGVDYPMTEEEMAWFVDYFANATPASAGEPVNRG